MCGLTARQSGEALTNPHPKIQLVMKYSTRPRPWRHYFERPESRIGANSLALLNTVKSFQVAYTAGDPLMNKELLASQEVFAPRSYCIRDNKLITDQSTHCTTHAVSVGVVYSTPDTHTY